MAKTDPNAGRAPEVPTPTADKKPAAKKPAAKKAVESVSTTNGAMREFTIYGHELSRLKDMGASRPQNGMLILLDEIEQRGSNNG